MYRYALVILLLVCSTCTAFSQELSYKKGGKVLYNDLVLSHPSAIEGVIQDKFTPEMRQLFKRYKSNRGLATVFGFAGGMGIGYPIGSAIGGGEFNAGLFAGGVGLVGIGLLFSSSANKTLKATVNLYNNTPTPVSFTPLIRQESGLTQVGMRIRF